MATKKPAAKKAAPAKKAPARKSINPKTVDDLKGASYNPRVITDKSLKQLKQSLVGGVEKDGTSYGDMSGIVFNRASGVLVSGHQRVKSIKGLPSKLTKKEVKKDGYGTVAVGFVEVKTPKGVVQIPYREVEWTDKQVEKAANVRANVSAGEFDQQKLGAILQELQQGSFEIESIGMDALESQKALIAHRNSQRANGKDVPAEKSSGKRARDDEEEEEEFQAVNVEEVEADLSCVCPRCKFRWAPKKNAKAGR